MLYNNLPQPFLVLAPMDDVTDIVFRSIVAECAAPDMYFTEFVNVDGLQSVGHDKLLPRLRKGEHDKPIIAQLWGLKPENFEKSAAEAVELGFDGIDLNFGCPDKTVVKNGACSAMIHNRDLAHKVIEATQRGAGSRVPVSAKTRLGFNEVDLSWHEFLLGHQLDALTVHFRTRKEMSKVPAQWEYAKELVTLRDRISPQTKLIGNGDVKDRPQALELAEQYGLDGIMIGRGVFADPFCFAAESPWPGYTQEQRIALYRRHVERFAKEWPGGERRLHTLNKFCKIYINGFDGAKELREQCMAATSVEALLDLL
jgi:tRNA-dihydrouridine synthase